MELKPCPFCGSAARLYSNGRHLVIYCPDTNCAGGKCFGIAEPDLAQEISAWNSRSYQPSNPADGKKCPNCIDGYFYKTIDYCKCGYEHLRMVEYENAVRKF